MKLRIKLLTWTAGIPVAMLREKTAEKAGLRAKDRVNIRVDSKKEFTVILDTVKKGLIKDNEIAVSDETRKILNLRIGQKVDIKIAPMTKSLIYIKKKLHGKPLSQKEIKEIINDIINNSLSEAEIALFISAMYRYGTSIRETIYLINSILESGSKLNLKRKMIVDKHSIGGIAGNRTTPLVISICASAGLIFPKTSSRAITSAAGTADVIETIAKVDFSMKDIKKIIQKANACMVWGGSLGMVPADSKIIQIEKILNIDPEAQLLASIMSKKLAIGSNYILIDIPYGKSAKVSRKKAEDLRKKFIKIGKYFKKKIEVVLTDGSQPIGNGIGPVLELIDVIKILDPKQKGPEDLEKKSLFLSGKILEMTKKAKKGQGEELAKEILFSGKAFRKFKQIIKNQRGALKKLESAKFRKNLVSLKSGIIREIDNKKINSLARVAGCPGDKLAGVYLYVHKKDKIKKKDPLLTIYAESKSRLNEAVRFYREIKPISIK